MSDQRPIDPNANYIIGGQALMALVANFAEASPEMRHRNVANIQAAISTIRPMPEEDPVDWKARYDAEVAAHAAPVEAVEVG